MAREYRNFTREEKIKAVKMVLVDKKSQMEVEKLVLGKKKCTGTINRWIREYIQEGEDNCFKKKAIITAENESKNEEINNYEKELESFNSKQSNAKKLTKRRD